MTKFQPPRIEVQKHPVPPPQPPTSCVIFDSNCMYVWDNGSQCVAKVTESGVAGADNESLKYENLVQKRVLGRGSSGLVRLVECRETGKQYAVKQVPVTSDAKKTIVEETKRLFDNSQFTVRTLMVCLRDQHLILVQEYMDCGSLQDILVVCASKSIKIPEHIISLITKQILQGLAHLHNRTKRGQMHRDLKPGNVLVNTKGECKLADFGGMAAVRTMGQSSFIGTPPYMSPERIRGEKYSTPGDIWAVGLMVAEMSQLKYPFNANAQFLELLTQVTEFKHLELPGASNELHRFVHSLMKQDSGQRPRADDALLLPFIANHSTTSERQSTSPTYPSLASWLQETVLPYMPNQASSLTPTPSAQAQ